MDGEDRVAHGPVQSHLSSLRAVWNSSPMRLASVVVVLHLPIWLLQRLTTEGTTDERPLFNLDLLVAALVACFSSVAGTVLILLAWGAELARSVARNFHFLSTLDLLDAARFADLPALRMFVSLPVVAAAALLLLCGVIAVRRTCARRRLALGLFAVAAAFQLADAANGTLNLFGLNKDARLVAINVAGSPTWNILHDQRRNPLASGALQSFDGAVSHEVLAQWHASHPDRSRLLVLVESMGLPRDAGLREWLADQLATPAIRARWRVRATSEGFVGATTSGELRTLCGLKGHYTRLTDELAAGCLPAAAKADGGEALGLHGFHLRMFDRRDWWPRIGLTPWDGSPTDGSRADMHCNKAFSGVCDRSVLREAVHDAQMPRRFVYALTLDTHLPLPADDVLPAALAIRCASADTSVVACAMVGRLGRVLTELESELTRADATPMVVVAGDHAPPFAEARNRTAFDDTRVPVLILEPID